MISSSGCSAGAFFAAGEEEEADAEEADTFAFEVFFSFFSSFFSYGSFGFSFVAFCSSFGFSSLRFADKTTGDVSFFSCVFFSSPFGFFAIGGVELPFSPSLRFAVRAGRSADAQTEADVEVKEVRLGSSDEVSFVVVFCFFFSSSAAAAESFRFFCSSFSFRRCSLRSFFSFFLFSISDNAEEEEADEEDFAAGETVGVGFSIFLCAVVRMFFSEMAELVDETRLLLVSVLAEDEEGDLAFFDRLFCRKSKEGERR